VRIRNFLHKGLKRLYEDDDPRGLPPACVDKLRNMLTFMEAMADASELRAIPTWRAHLLTGDRKGTWGLHVTKNWRLTFSLDRIEREIRDVNFEDYH
jgi:proteic killer suppression protein